MGIVRWMVASCAGLLVATSLGTASGAAADDTAKPTRTSQATTASTDATTRAAAKNVLRAPVVTAVALPALVRFTWTRGTSRTVTKVKWEVDVTSDPGPTAIVSRQKYSVPGDPGDVVSVRVRAVQGTKNGPWSDIVQAEIPTPEPPTPLPTPSGVTVTALSPTQATIAWQGSAAVERVDVILNGTKAATVNPPNQSATLTGLTAGSAYGVQVQAIQGTRSSALTDAVTFTTPLTAPMGLTVSSVTSTSASVGWQPVSGASSYDVLVGGTVVGSGVTGATYALTGLTSGTSYVIGVRARYSSTSVSGTSTMTITTSVDAGQVPINTALPVASVTAFIAPAPGVVLTATAGTWSSTAVPTYTYQWQRSLDDSVYTDITSATGTSYIVRQADLNYYLRVRVTATNGNGSAIRASAASAKVVAFAPSQPLAAQGYAVADDTLTLGATTWSSSPPPTLTVTWQASSDDATWSPVSSGPAFLTVTDALFGKYIRARVVASGATGVATYFTASRGPVASALNIVAPELLGSPPVVGDTVCAGTGVWTPSVASLSIAYAWQTYDPARGVWSPVPGQATSCYAPARADLGHYVRSVVSATNASADATPVLAYSAPIGPVLPFEPNTLANVAAPVITGVPSPAVALTTTAGTWTPATGVTLSYQWQRSSNSTTWSNISGATSTTYTPTASDLNYYIRTTLTGISGGQSLTAVSAPTVKVGTPYASAVPTVTGAARAPQTLTMSSAGTWLNTPATYDYQWQVSSDGLVWSDIAGATGTSVALGFTEIADAVRLRVTATNAVGSTIAYSSWVGPVAPPLNTMAPQITGVPSQDDTLYVSDGEWSGITGQTYGYDWEYSDDGGATWYPIAGGGVNSDEYVLQWSDVGHLVRCRISVYYVVNLAGVGGSVTTSAISNVVGPILP